jgi:hypothetical protein
VEKTRIPKMGMTKKEKLKTTPMTIFSATIPTTGMMMQMLVTTHADPTTVTAHALIATMMVMTRRGRAVVTPLTPNRVAKGTAWLPPRR